MSMSLGPSPAPSYIFLVAAAASSRQSLPRIDKWDTAIFETADIARDHAGAVGARDGRDHQIERRGRAAGPSTGGENVRVGRCGRRVEREHAPVEIVCEYGSSRRFKRSAAEAVRHDGEACEDFRLTNRRGEQRLFRLAGDPCSHLRRRPGAHDRGQDVGVEDEDQSSWASIEPGRIAIRQTRRQLEIVRAAKRLEAGADALIEIARR
jgi:DNA-directed RNA polymerase subunit RPC12/RpoP